MKNAKSTAPSSSSTLSQDVGLRRGWVVASPNDHNPFHIPEDATGDKATQSKRKSVQLEPAVHESAIDAPRQSRITEDPLYKEREDRTSPEPGVPYPEFASNFVTAGIPPSLQSYLEYLALLKSPPDDGRISAISDFNKKKAYPGPYIRILDQAQVPLPWANKRNGRGIDQLYGEACFVRAMADRIPPENSRLDPVVVTYSKSTLPQLTDRISTALVTVIKGIPTEDTTWSADGVAQTFGIQKSGRVLVSRNTLTAHLEPCRLDTFFARCDDERWAVEQLPVQNNNLPGFTESLDHGYRFGWVQSHIEHVTQDLPRGIERQHSRDPTDGQATILFVQHGSIFLHILRSSHFYDALGRSMLSSTNTSSVLEARIMLRKGEMIIIPPCVDYRYYATAPTIISGRYFWNYNSMHLTEVARTKGHARFSLYPYSSVDALDCHTTMCRMLSVLPFTDFPALGKRPVLSLCGMTRFPCQYLHASVDEDARNTVERRFQWMQDYIFPNDTPPHLAVEAVVDSNTFRLYELTALMARAIFDQFIVMYTFPSSEDDVCTSRSTQAASDYLFNVTNEPWYHAGSSFTHDQWWYLQSML